MAMTDLTIVRRSMSSRLFSTATTVLTVAIAVALMLVLLSMRDASRRAFERGSGNMHLLVSADPSRLVAVLNGIFYANPPQRPLTWLQYRRVSRLPGIEFAIPVQHGDSFRGFPVTATTTQFFTYFSPDPAYSPAQAIEAASARQGEPAPEPAWPVAQGRIFQRPFEAVLGARVARATGLRPGDAIFLTHGTADDEHAHEHRDFSVSIVGILGPTGTPHDRAVFIDLDSSWIIHAHERRQRDDPDIARTTVDDLTDADRLITGIYIRGRTRPGRRTSPAVPTLFTDLSRDAALTVAAPADEISNLFQIVSNIDRILLAMAGVVILSSGIGIMLALYNSMDQRRRQIAVLRVLGCSRGRVCRIVLMEAAAIGLLGAAAGTALSVGGGVAAARVLRGRLGIVIEPAFSPYWLAAVVGGTILLAAVAGLIPAVMAYRTPVAKNLKPLG
jgi:putative ABC transport system permease protein